MLHITSVTDLRKYLEIRLKMTEGQNPRGQYTTGMIYAFTEAIRAIHALEEFQKSLESAQQTNAGSV